MSDLNLGPDTPHPNPELGEVAVTLPLPDGGAEKRFIMRPTFEAMAKIEARLDVGCTALLSRVMQGDVRLIDLTVIIGEGIRAAGGQADDEKLGRMIFAAGTPEMIQPSGALIANMLTGGREAVRSGEKRPEAEALPSPSGTFSDSRPLN